MSIITDRTSALAVAQEYAARGACLAILGTASHWNTEAILLAAQRLQRSRGLDRVAVCVSMTFTYAHMPQCERVTFSRDPRAGFLSMMAHLQALCGSPDSPYAAVTVLPHLDHAHPVRDRWALTEGLPFLASVMFDAQSYPPDENRRLTAEYVAAHGKQVLVEGILEELAVHGAAAHAAPAGDYAARAQEYVAATGVDYLVADLGTEQQAQTVGGARYLGERAREITARLGRPQLVLHGTSCLDPSQLAGLSRDGIARVNLWTRIAREAGQFAAQGVHERRSQIQAGEFDAADSRAYLMDSIERAAALMEETLIGLGYAGAT